MAEAVSPGSVRKAGGRPKGSRNKRTVELVQRAEAKGITPLDLMLEVMHDLWREGDGLVNLTPRTTWATAFQPRPGLGGGHDQLESGRAPKRGTLAAGWNERLQTKGRMVRGITFQSSFTWMGITHPRRWTGRAESAGPATPEYDGRIAYFKTPLN